MRVGQCHPQRLTGAAEGGCGRDAAQATRRGAAGWRWDIRTHAGGRLCWPWGPAGGAGRRDVSGPAARREGLLGPLVHGRGNRRGGAALLPPQPRRAGVTARRASPRTEWLARHCLPGSWHAYIGLVPQHLHRRVYACDNTANESTFRTACVRGHARFCLVRGFQPSTVGHQPLHLERLAPVASPPTAQVALWWVSVIATSMLIGDGVLTPAISGTHSPCCRRMRPSAPACMNPVIHSIGITASGSRPIPRL